MPQPPAYSRQFDFSGFTASQPSDQQPGAKLDAEFDAIVSTVRAIRANLAKIQRDDGYLGNNSVRLDSLAPEAIIALGAGSAWTPRGEWLTGTAYELGDFVSTGGGTYVASDAHVSGDFATDQAAGRWITIFDPSGSIPQDGSVDTAKLADGAVTIDKLAVDEFDLAGGVRAAGGLAAGSAVLGEYAIGAKAAVGDVIMSVARATRDQGRVGVRLDGGATGRAWRLSQAADSDTVALENVTDGIVSMIFAKGGEIDVPQTLRVTGDNEPTQGVGLEITFFDGNGDLLAFDRTQGKFKGLRLRGSTIYFSPSNVDVMSLTTGGVTMSEGTVAGQPIGYRGLPQVMKTAAYVLALTDAGKHISITAGGVTIPANSAVAFPIGSVVRIYNNSAVAQNVTIDTDTLRHAGGTVTGTWQLQAYDLLKLVKVGATTWLASSDSGISLAKYAVNGFERKSDGSYELWGSFSADPDSYTPFNYSSIDPAIALVSFSRGVVSGIQGGNSGQQDNPPAVTSSTALGLTVYNAFGNAVTVQFIARGK